MEEILKNMPEEQRILMECVFMLGRAYEHTEHSKTAACFYNPEDEAEAIAVYEYFDSVHLKRK